METERPIDSSDVVTQVRALHGIALRSPMDDSLLLLDKYCRTQFHVTDKQRCSPSSDGFLAALGETNSFVPKYAVCVDVLCGDLLPAVPPFLSRLTEALPEARTLTVRLVLDPVSRLPWYRRAATVYDLLYKAFHRSSPEANWNFVVEGDLAAPLPEEFASAFVRESFRLRHLCVHPERDLSDEKCEGLLAATRSGMRIPAVFYVGHSFASDPIGHVKRALQASQYSGYSLRPLSAHYDYAIAEWPSSIPAEQFLELLGTLYREIPYYDDVLAPIDQIKQRVDPQNDEKEHLSILLDRGGSVGVYRKVPCLRHVLGMTSDLLNWHDADLKEALFSAGLASEAADVLCHSCEWRSVCGGMDQGAGAEPFLSPCASWQFGFETLLWERVYQPHSGKALTFGGHNGTAS